MVDYHDAIGKLKAEYGLSFTHNPGGGEFYLRDIADTCQIGMQDDEKDYKRLVEWLRKHNAEELDDVLQEIKGR